MVDPRYKPLQFYQPQPFSHLKHVNLVYSDKSLHLCIGEKKQLSNKLCVLTDENKKHGEEQTGKEKIRNATKEKRGDARKQIP